MARVRETADEASLTELMRRHRHPALAIAQSRLFHKAWGDDVVQEAFIRVLRNRQSFTPGLAFAPWFYTILRHVCSDFSRREQRQQRRSEALGVLQEESPRQAAPERTASLEYLLQGLAADEREILISRFVYQQPYDTIAAGLGQAMEAVKKRALRALKKIRLQLSRTEDE